VTYIGHPLCCGGNEIAITVNTKHLFSTNKHGSTTWTLLPQSGNDNMNREEMTRLFD